MATETVEVLVPRDVEEEFPGRVAATDPRVRVRVVEPDGAAPGAETPRVLLRAGLSTEAMRRALSDYPTIAWLHSYAAGVETLLPALEGREVTLTNSAGVHAEPIAEWTVLMMLAHAKRLPRLLEHQRNRSWSSEPGEELGGKTLGVVGAGGIGGAIGRRARGLDMRVIGTRSSGEPTEHIPEMYTPDRLPELLAESDYVAIAAPLTRATRGLIGEPELRAMKSTAVLLNVARGPVVDTDALVRALHDGRIGGACLDVTDPEPLPPEHPLWTAPGAIITGHTSGHSPRTGERTLRFFQENLRRWLAGGELVNVVDPAREY